MTHAGPSRIPASTPAVPSGSNAQAPEVGGRRKIRKPWWTGALQPPLIEIKGTKIRKVPHVPYDLKTVIKQSEGTKQLVCQCVEFFPFVGPKRPKATLGRRDWDRWEGAAAYCVGDKVIIGRCHDDVNGACWEPIWQVAIKRQKRGADKEDLYHVTWSINPFTLDPIVIAGGKLGLIYVFDPVGKRHVRTLRGHGDALAVCPTMPHILASGSRDHTTRIWNLYGHELELAPGELPDQNYPMGDADEGNHVVAILCGNWPGGHRDDVCTVSWHPSHRAIATASRDHSFKIWPLPELPPPRVPKPARNYRPILVSSPLFSTNRIAIKPVDSIHWLSNDIIVARTLDAIITFQWLGYLRYFERGTWEPLGQTVMHVLDSAHWHDINDSRSIMILSTLRVRGQHTYHRTGFHSSFSPTPNEAQDLAANPNLVQDFLVAIPQMGVHPEIVLYAPTLAPPNPSPELDLRPRVDLQDFGDYEDDEDEDGAGDGAASGSNPSPKRRRVGEEEAGQAGTSTPRVPGRASGTPSPHPRRRSGAHAQTSSGSRIPETVLEDEDSHDGSDSDISTDTTPDSDDEADGTGSSSASASDEAQDNPNNEPRRKSKRAKQYQWLLRADMWTKIVKKHKSKGSYNLSMGSSTNSVVTCCAISPRGAKWVLGVGQAESLFIWRIKDARYLYNP